MKKIIVAEDDGFLASAYRLKLSKSGFDIKIATDGNAVIEFLRGGFIPDLILLDLVMPQMDGFATLSELNKDPSWRKIPVIIASNLGQKEDIDRGMALGAKDYIVKADITIEKIVEKIKKMIPEYAS